MTIVADRVIRAAIFIGLSLLDPLLVLGGWATRRTVNLSNGTKMVSQVRYAPHQPAELGVIEVAWFAQCFDPVVRLAPDVIA